MDSLSSFFEVHFIQTTIKGWVLWEPALLPRSPANEHLGKQLFAGGIGDGGVHLARDGQRLAHLGGVGECPAEMRHDAARRVCRPAVRLVALGTIEAVVDERVVHKAFDNTHQCVPGCKMRKREMMML